MNGRDRAALGFGSIFHETPHRLGARLAIGLLAIGLLAIGLAPPREARAEFRGHGGPVRAMAMSADGAALASASFDSTVILWSVREGNATQVLRFHEGPVHAVAFLPDGRIASAGEDRRIAIWRRGLSAPEQVLEGHQAPVTALALGPDGVLGSAAFDGTARIWRLADGAAAVLEGHRGPVTGLAYHPGLGWATAGQDGSVRVWQGMDPARTIQLDAPIHALTAAGDTLVAAGADGAVTLIGPDNLALRRIPIAEWPLAALAASLDGRMIAAAGLRGALAIIDRAEARIARRLEGPAFPLWSLAFSADGRDLLTGGNDRVVRVWSVATGEPSTPALAAPDDRILQRHAGERGAEVFKACASCHTLTPDDGHRAGPTLHGLMGRRIGTAPGYDYSPALKQLDIVWSRQTLAKLFEIGPTAYTPGTKMPEQTIGNAEDRAALADFIARVGR